MSNSLLLILATVEHLYRDPYPAFRDPRPKTASHRGPHWSVQWWTPYYCNRFYSVPNVGWEKFEKIPLGVGGKEVRGDVFEKIDRSSWSKFVFLNFGTQKIQ
jgi:hypothetical protein